MKYAVFIAFYLMVSLSGSAQNTVCLNLVANPDVSQAAFADFTNYVDVFGFKVYGESGVSDEKVLHVAAVTAELLDQDEDGTADDSALIIQLNSQGALIPVFSSEGSPAENSFNNNYNGNGASAVLYAGEVDPSQPGHWGDDATVEEVLHTINHVGHIQMYPAVFGISPNSSIMSAAMDSARGGQFLTIPNPYSANAWYHYDDETCDYGCMAVEYMYWSIVSWMGILDDAATCSGIANEWEPCSPTLLQSTDVVMHGLIVNPQYQLPQLAPDGNYCPNGTGIQSTQNIAEVKIYPNPNNGHFKLEAKTGAVAQIIDATGTVVFSKYLVRGSSEIDVSYLSPGNYILKSNNTSYSLVIQ